MYMLRKQIGSNGIRQKSYESSEVVFLFLKIPANSENFLIIVAAKID